MKCILYCLLMIPVVAIAQPDKVIRTGDTTFIANKEKGETETFVYVEEMPQPLYELNAFMAKNMTYPKDAEEQGIQGKVLVSFIVRKDGGIDSTYVKRSLFPSLDAEALRIIKLLPPWKPGKQHGKPVDMPFTMPVIFKLE